jgi:hypothetical protein
VMPCAPAHDVTVSFLIPRCVLDFDKAEQLVRAVDRWRRGARQKRALGIARAHTSAVVAGIRPGRKLCEDKAVVHADGALPRF